MGTQGRGLLSGFLNKKETQVIAVCDVDTNRRENAQRMVDTAYTGQLDRGAQKGCAGYADFRLLLNRSDIDAVVIATPDHWHAYIAVAAARARKDIYCEKPLCQSIHQARAMVKAARKNRRVFQVGSMQRSSREFRVACELVRNGYIGKVERVAVGVGGPGKPCDLPTETEEPGLDWNLWLGPAPSRGYHSELSPRGVHKHFPNWRAYREYGGGAVTDWGAHHFDIAQWGLGMDASGPVEVFPAAQPKATNGVRLRYANGVEVEHATSDGVIFFGTAGKVYVNRGKFDFWLGNEPKTKPEEKLIDKLNRIDSEYLVAPKVPLYRSTDHKADWIAAIKHRKAPICDVEIGARSVTVCHLVNLAYYHGKPFKWNPQREQFGVGTGDPGWLDVPTRTPWQVA